MPSNEENAVSRDKDGKLVRVGDFIRVLGIDQETLDELPKEEARELLSLVGECLAIQHINPNGSAIVERYWDHGNGKITYHSIAIFPAAFSLESSHGA